MLIRIQILHFQVTKSYIEYRENMDEKQKIGLKKQKNMFELKTLDTFKFK